MRLQASAVFVLSGLIAPAATVTADSVPNVVQFNRDVRPIFSDKCYTCHGPDKGTRKTTLRFDVESGAKADLGGRFAIVPGDTSKSLLIGRITAGNTGLRMPPAYTGAALTPREIGILKRWVEQGAKWQKHWSFIPPERPAYPALKDSRWPRNGVDHFVLSRLEQEGLRPSPEADKQTLIRRLALDLTGLPPTPAEVDFFVKDPSPDAYEKLIDRLLQSSRYGERMAARWLDGARYADTNGYQSDGERSMWRWRDWVIEAFNRNMPFDQFTVEQLAGDMLPDATLDQKIASGFNRNHRGNGEGGIVPEEYEMEYVVDRIDTTSTVWLGLTLGCARCHDHKYDPLTQKEYYQIFGYFNNIPEKGLAWKFGNSPPFIKAPTREQQVQLQSLQERLAAAQKRFAEVQPELAEAQRQWEQKAHDPAVWMDSEGTLASYPLGEKVEFDGKYFVDAGKIADFGPYQPFTLAAWVYAKDGDGILIARERDDETDKSRGYSLRLVKGKVQMNLVTRWLDEAIRVETEAPLPLKEWHQVTMVYDGSAEARGVEIYLDGVPQKLVVLLDQLNNGFSVKESLRIGSGADSGQRFRGYLRNVKVYDEGLTGSEAAVLATTAGVEEILTMPAARRSKQQADKLAKYFLQTAAPAHIQEARRGMRAARRSLDNFSRALPTVMVMQERAMPRDTFILARGAYDHPGERVQRGVPAALSWTSSPSPKDRLAFARWIVDPANPLTARVAVNRFWQIFFGTGLVKTAEDFGSQGEWPSHPELLDWLATRFAQSGWDMKSLIKTIVTSATYRQASKASPELTARDPENRLLAHGPRFRLPAEVLRDQALALSGLLVEKIGGPSVKPYQPAGLWSELSGKEDYKQDHGESLYRRSLYTYWKRAVPPPSMTTFDAAGRETCIVRTGRTNTPLQALDLMNDVTYVEASRVMAQRVIKEGGSEPADRIRFAFRLATAHDPGPETSAILLNALRYYSDLYQSDPQAAGKLIRQGESSAPKDIDSSQLAAYTMVASMILNLDETVTKN